jgi:pyruvate-formate lyase-activating enzyme
MMFCCRPFEQYYVDVAGDVHLCCPQWIAMPVGNVLSSNPLEVWNNWVAKNIRNSVLDQSFRHCTNCRLLPGPSGCVVDEPPRAIPTDRVHTLTVAYDPACNLRCRSCRHELQGTTAKAERIQDVLLSSGIFKSVDRVCSSGSGDPLASRLFWELLSKLPPQNHPHLRLVLQTNGLLLDTHTWERLASLGYAERINEISISVDASTAATYEENREGDFERLMQNIKMIAKRQIPLQLNFVVQANNYREMPDFVALALGLGAQRIYFSALDNWETYEKSNYLERAVHLPGHPEHSDLLEMLRSPIFNISSLVTLAGLPRP